MDNRAARTARLEAAIALQESEVLPILPFINVLFGSRYAGLTVARSCGNPRKGPGRCPRGWSSSGPGWVVRRDIRGK